MYAGQLLARCIGCEICGRLLTHEEDGKNDIVLVLVKTKIILETECAGVGDIDTIDEGEEVEDTETWHDVPGYPAQKSSLCGVGWALDEDGLAVAGVGGGVWLLYWLGALLIVLMDLWLLLSSEL